MPAWRLDDFVESVLLELLDDGVDLDAARSEIAGFLVARWGLTDPVGQVDFGPERSRAGHLLWLQADGHRRPGT